VQVVEGVHWRREGVEEGGSCSWYVLLSEVGPLVVDEYEEVDGRREV